MYKIEFTEEDMKVLDKALKVLPYCEVAPIINSINRQVKEAQQSEQIQEES